MNEYMWKKLGEIKAFATTGVKFLERGHDGLTTVFTESELEALLDENEKHIKRIDKIADEAGASETVNSKAEATEEKILDMQNRYLEDEDDWEDAMELLEWAGFFHGGAVVHWNLIKGASQSVRDPELTALVEGGTKFHSHLLDTIADALKELADKG